MNSSPNDKVADSPPITSGLGQERVPQGDNSSPEPTKNEQTVLAVTATPVSSHPSPNRKAPQDWWTVGLTLALVFVGVLQVVAMFWQTSYMEGALRATEEATKAAKISADAATASVEQNQTALETARLDQRAWMLVKHVTTPVFEIGKPLRAIVTFVNKGNTPAIEVSMRLTNEALPPGVKPAFSELKPALGGSRGIIGPEVEIWFSHPLTLTPQHGVGVLSKEDFGALVSGEKTICMHGRAEYKDVFGRTQWLKFCYVMRTFQDQDTPSGYDVTWEVFPLGNDLSSN